MNQLYRPILKQAWFYTWRHKFLWLFGFFVAWLGTSGEYDLFIRSFEQINAKGTILVNFNQFIATTGLFSADFLANLKNLVTNNPGTLLPVILLFLLILLAIIFFILAVITSQAGLINGLQKITKNQTTTLREGLAIGMSKFWPLFWFNLFYRVIIFAIFLTLGVIFAFYFVNFISNGYALAGEALLYFLLFLIGFIIFVPLAFMLSFVTRYAICYVVTKNYRFKEALSQGFRLFFKNWLVSLELAFILLIFHLTIAIVLLLLSRLVVIPLSYLLSIFYATNFIFGFWAMVIIIALAFLALVIFIVAAFSTYFWSCWTMLFLQLTEKGGSSKLIRLSASIPAYIRNK